MKKRTTKIAAALFAATLAVTGLGGVTAPVVNAAESIIINNEEAGHRYVAYQLFKGEKDGNALKNITLGDDLDKDKKVDGKNLAEAIKAAYTSVELTADSEADSIANAIQVIAGEDKELTTDEAKTLSKILNSYIKDDATGTSLTQSATATKNLYSYSVKDLATGYYLVKDTTTTTGTGDDTKNLAQTLYMLRVVDGQAATPITAKSDAPTVTKKVASASTVEGKLASGATWVDGATYNSGDYIAYKLTGTVPDNYDTYDSYFYEFEDTVYTGLVIDEDSVKVYVNGTEEVTIDDQVEVSNKGHKLTVTFDDLKTEVPSVGAGDTVVVKYRAQLTGNDLVVNDDNDGKGNVNGVKLHYTNNPNAGGSGDHKTTPEDQVTVFTFKFTGIKEDPNGNKLKDAKFELYDGSQKLAETTSQNGTGLVDFGITLKGGVNVDKTYTVKEATPPNGFQSVGSFDVKIKAIYTEGTETDDSTTAPTVTFKVTVGDPTLSGSTTNEGNKTQITIVDRPTSNLPMTGDSGRALYYAFGGMVAIAALLYLLREKKNA